MSRRLPLANGLFWPFLRCTYIFNTKNYYVLRNNKETHNFCFLLLIIGYIIANTLCLCMLDKA